MGIKGKFVKTHDGRNMRRFDKDNLTVLLAPLANDTWLITAFGKHAHQETIKGKSIAFQWAEGFLLYA